ncbi:MAG: tandem-95 repeat protein, partial [Deltaproteobacteria bacterium]|nr:tandem-95 repeat protein [Deltaproteobacteria bacterium]
VLVAGTGEFTWTPDFTQAGTYDVTFTVSDGTAQDAETVRLTIANTNRPPVLTPTPDKSVAEAGTLTFTLLGSDPDQQDTLIFSAAAVPPGATFNTQSRTFSWTPGYDQAGTKTVTFSLTDGEATVTDSVDIVVANTNRPPTVNTPAPRTVAEGALLAVSFTGSDPDGDALSWAAVPLPQGAALDAATGAFTWTPGYTQAGTWPMTLTVTDGAATATTSFSVAVTPTNRPPSLSGSGPAQVDEGTEWQLALNATDPDGTSVVLACTGLPAGAVLETFAARVRWTPGFTQAGTYTFACSASDGSLTTQASFSVTVLQVNQPPAWPQAPPPLLREGTAASVPLAATDPDGDTLSYSATGLPPGAAYDGQSGLLTWTPGYTQAGTWPITLAASDGQASIPRAVTLVVADTNLPPSVEALPPATVREGALLEVAVSGSDGDGDTLTWSAQLLPVGASFDPATRSFRWRPDFGQAGTYTVTIKAADEALSATASLAITVTLGNRPPELYVPGPKTLTESELVTFSVSGMDPEGQPLTFGAKDLPEGATFAPGTRTFSWVPSYEQAGRWTVLFTVTDGDHATEAGVDFTVGNVNRG